MQQLRRIHPPKQPVAEALGVDELNGAFAFAGTDERVLAFRRRGIADPALYLAFWGILIDYRNTFPLIDLLFFVVLQEFNEAIPGPPNQTYVVFSYPFPLKRRLVDVISLEDKLKRLFSPHNAAGFSH